MSPTSPTAVSPVQTTSASGQQFTTRTYVQQQPYQVVYTASPTAMRYPNQTATVNSPTMSAPTGGYIYTPVQVGTSGGQQQKVMMSNVTQMPSPPMKQMSSPVKQQPVMQQQNVQQQKTIQQVVAQQQKK
jgi:hypothetical protein